MPKSAPYQTENAQYLRIRFPLMPGAEFTLWLRDPGRLLPRDLWSTNEPIRGGFIQCRAVERIDRFVPSVLSLKIGVMVFRVRLATDGRCYVLREVKQKKRTR